MFVVPLLAMLSGASKLLVSKMRYIWGVLQGEKIGYWERASSQIFQL